MVKNIIYILVCTIIFSNFVGLKRSEEKMKKLENWVLPIVHSEKVKKCMQLAVERAVHDANDWEAHGAPPPLTEITVQKYLPIFNSLSDCDFENPRCTNHLFQFVIDEVFKGIDERTVLNILNNTYAIAIHALNTDYPKYKIPEYRNIASATASNVIVQEMVIACAIFIMGKYNTKKKVFNALLNFDNDSIAVSLFVYLTDLYALHHNYLFQGLASSRYYIERKKVLMELRESIEFRIKEQQKRSDIQPLLDAIVRYAEDLPSDEWNAVRAIGRMLHAKGAAARYIPTEVYQQYEQRIDKLANCTRPEQATKDDNEEKNTAKDETPPPDAGELDADEKDKRIQSAIEEWLKGGKRDKSHWFAVFKALVVRNLKADDMKNFCKQMYEWGYTKEQLTYCSVSKASQMYLPDKPSEWITMQRTAKGKELNMIKAFVAFAECLRNQGL